MNRDAEEAVLGLLSLSPHNVQPPVPLVPLKRKQPPHSSNQQRRQGANSDLSTALQQQQQHYQQQQAQNVPPIQTHMTMDVMDEREKERQDGTGTDDGIHCICGFTHDDGFCIACDDCGRWCHAACFGIEVGKDPENWSCWVCLPRPVDSERARMLQRARQEEQRMRERVEQEEQMRLLKHRQDHPEPPPPLRRTVPKDVPRRRASPGSDRKQHRKASAVGVDGSGGVKKKRRASILGASARSNAAHAHEEDDVLVDIDEPWNHSYVHIEHDIIPHAETREKLRRHARGWRGVTALSPFDAKATLQPVHESSCSVRPPSYAVHTTVPIPSEHLITPFTSTITPSSTYLSDPLNSYAHLGMPKPFVHLIGPPLDVALDARVTGDSSRYVRSGCRPNAVLRPVLCPADSDSLSFAVFALRDLKANEEVILGWEWDDGNAVHALPALIETPHIFPTLNSDEHIQHLRNQMSNILHALSSTFTTCACGSKAKDCALTQMEAFVDGKFPPPHLHSPTAAQLQSSLYRTRKVDLGPLLATKRGFRTKERIPQSSGLGGVEMCVDEESQGGARSNEGGAKEQTGRSVAGGDDVDMAAHEQRKEQERCFASNKADRRVMSIASLTSPTPSAATNPTSSSMSHPLPPLRPPDPPNATTAAPGTPDAGPGQGQHTFPSQPVGEEEDKMPPKMRKRWMHREAEALRDMYGNGNGLSPANSGSSFSTPMMSVHAHPALLSDDAQHAQPGPSALPDVDARSKRGESRVGLGIRINGSDAALVSSGARLDRDAPDEDVEMTGSDVHAMPPPPLPAALDPTTVVSSNEVQSGAKGAAGKRVKRRGSSVSSSKSPIPKSPATPISSLPPDTSETASGPANAPFDAHPSISNDKPDGVHPPVALAQPTMTPAESALLSKSRPQQDQHSDGVAMVIAAQTNGASASVEPLSPASATTGLVASVTLTSAPTPGGNSPAVPSPSPSASFSRLSLLSPILSSAARPVVASNSDSPQVAGDNASPKDREQVRPTVDVVASPSQHRGHLSTSLPPSISSSRSTSDVTLQTNGDGSVLAPSRTTASPSTDSQIPFPTSPSQADVKTREPTTPLSATPTTTPTTLTQPPPSSPASSQSQLMQQAQERQPQQNAQPGPSPPQPQRRVKMTLKDFAERKRRKKEEEAAAAAAAASANAVVEQSENVNSSMENSPAVASVPLASEADGKVDDHVPFSPNGGRAADDKGNGVAGDSSAVLRGVGIRPEFELKAPSPSADVSNAESTSSEPNSISAKGKEDLSHKDVAMTDAVVEKADVTMTDAVPATKEHVSVSSAPTTADLMMVEKVGPQVIVIPPAQASPQQQPQTRAPLAGPPPSSTLHRLLNLVSIPPRLPFKDVSQDPPKDPTRDPVSKQAKVEFIEQSLSTLLVDSPVQATVSSVPDTKADGPSTADGKDNAQSLFPPVPVAPPAAPSKDRTVSPTPSNAPPEDGEILNTTYDNSPPPPSKQSQPPSSSEPIQASTSHSSRNTYTPTSHTPPTQPRFFNQSSASSSASPPLRPTAPRRPSAPYRSPAPGGSHYQPSATSTPTGTSTPASSASSSSVAPANTRPPPIGPRAMTATGFGSYQGSSYAPGRSYSAAGPPRGPSMDWDRDWPRGSRPRPRGGWGR